MVLLQGLSALTLFLGWSQQHPLWALLWRVPPVLTLLMPPSPGLRALVSRLAGASSQPVPFPFSLAGLRELHHAPGEAGGGSAHLRHQCPAPQLLETGEKAPPRGPG